MSYHLIQCGVIHLTSAHFTKDSFNKWFILQIVHFTKTLKTNHFTKRFISQNNSFHKTIHFTKRFISQNSSFHKTIYRYNFNW